jgi:hypothetical protein
MLVRAVMRTHRLAALAMITGVALSAACNLGIVDRPGEHPSGVGENSVSDPADSDQSCTIHVSTTGSNSASGSSDAPLRTLQAAVDRAVPGDVVCASAGLYTESVVFNRSGQAGAPIELRGERGPNGELLTIIDGSDATTGWVPAPEAGEGIWKTNSLAYLPCALTSNGKTIWRLRRKEDGEFGRMALSGALPWWDGIEALFSYDVNTRTVFLRFRNGDDPATMNVRSARDDDGWRCDAVMPSHGVINIQNRSYIAVKGFMIQGGANGVIIGGTLGNADHNVISDNKIINGYSKVNIYGDANHNIVRRNFIQTNHIANDSSPGGFVPGSMSYRRFDEPYPYGQRAHQYNEERYAMAAHHLGVVMALYNTIGRGNEIDGNEFFELFNAVQIGPTASDMLDTRIHHNYIHSCYYGMGMHGDHTRGFHFYDNRYDDIWVPMRMGVSPNGDREMYIYRNRVFATPGYDSGGVYISEFPCSTAYQGSDAQSLCRADYGNAPYPIPGDVLDKIYVYHNTFVGGTGSLTLQHMVSGYGYPNMLFVNNIFQTDGSALWCNRDVDFFDVRERMGVFDYNWFNGEFVGCGNPMPVWAGSNNILSSTRLWDESSVPDYQPTGSARNAGIDVSRPFTIDGVTYPPLPGMEPGYFSGAAPHMGAVQ